MVAGVLALLLLAYIIGWMAASEEYGYLSIAMVIGLFGAFLILKHPLFGLALMFFVVPLGPATRVIGGERTITFALAALLIGIYGARVLILHEKIKLDRVSKLACAFIGWGVITCLWAHDPVISLKYILRLIQLVAIYVLILNYCRSQRHLDVITLSFAAGAVVAATVAIFMRATYLGSETASARSTLSEDFNPNYFSAMLVTGTILIFYHLYKTRYNVLRVFLVLSIIPVMYSIILSQSRTAWIALPTSLLISLILATKNLKLIKKALVIVTILIGVFTSAYYAGIIDEAIVKRYRTLTSGDNTTATSGRTEIWKVGLEMIRDTFPLGVGFKNYKVVFLEYAPDAKVIIENPKVAHNVFLESLAETGLVGFILFMSIFIYLFRCIWHIGDPVTRLIQMWLFVSFVLISAVGTSLFRPWFWFVLVLVALAASLEKQKNQKFLYASNFVGVE